VHITSNVSNAADLDGSEAFMVDQTVNCLSLFALSGGEYALAADTSRYVLKRQEGRADAGIWIMRGLAFAGMGKGDIVVHRCPDTTMYVKPSVLFTRGSFPRTASFYQRTICERRIRGAAGVSAHCGG
jgi:hypothetical protein